MQFDEFLAIPFGAVVEFRFPHHDGTWRGWLASGPYDVVCDGASDSDRCFVAHSESRAFDCVDIQLDPADWPYQEQPLEDGEQYVRVPIVDVLGVHELPPERVPPPERQPQTLRPEPEGLLRHLIVIDDGRGMTPLTPGTPAWDNLQHVTRSRKLARGLREIVGRLRRLSYS